MYLGTDANALPKQGTVATNSFTPTGLELGTKYYWRIDEVNQTTNPTTWAGDVWNFTTPEFLVVDDMESYNATDKAIFDTWLDGYGTNTNGGQVGYGQPANNTFCETTTVHGGKQSMPFLYGRDGITTSEATRTYTTAQNWKAAGIKTLVVFFHGTSGNATGQLYVKINGGKVTYPGDAAIIATPIWKQWNIDLSTVAAAGAVTSFALGITGSGTGTLLIDDIRLYKTAPATVTPTDPGTTALVAYYALENDAKDSKGGTSGTLTDITFEDSAMTGFGKAAVFNGTTSYLDLGASIGNLMSTLTNATFAVWVKVGATSAWERAFDFGTAVTSGNPQAYMYMSPFGSANPALRLLDYEQRR